MIPQGKWLLIPCGGAPPHVGFGHHRHRHCCYSGWFCTNGCTDKAPPPPPSSSGSHPTPLWSFGLRQEAWECALYGATAHPVYSLLFNIKLCFIFLYFIFYILPCNFIIPFIYQSYLPKSTFNECPSNVHLNFNEQYYNLNFLHLNIRFFLNHNTTVNIGFLF
jgi:hypothetical protein